MARGRPDFSPTAVDVVLRPEWAAKEGTDKTFGCQELNADFEDHADVVYDVPAGKTLYINQSSFQGSADAAADADNNQIIHVFLQDVTAMEYPVNTGANGGGQVTFPKPIVFPAGHRFAMRITARANHTIRITATATGYEL